MTAIDDLERRHRVGLRVHVWFLAGLWFGWSSEPVLSEL